MKLDDKVVFITGGSRGIGAMFVEGFLAAGCELALGGTDLPATKADVAQYLLDAVPLMGVTMPTVELLGSLNSHSNPLPVRAVTGMTEWALIDLQPDWAQQLLRFPHHSAATTFARRAAVWSALNGVRYGAGPMRETRQARARVAAAPLRHLAPTG